jgi:hypothetical protein
MANIATVATAAIVRRGVPRGRVTPHALLRAMTRFYGRSYCVPAWGYDDYPRGRVYAQHGEKWSPTGVVRAWERYGQFLEAIWVRWYDDGGDHDAFFAYTAAGFGASDWCRYGFDRVRVSGADALVRNLEHGSWRPDGPGAWAADIGGSYRAANDRCNLLFDHPPLPGRTTPVRGQMLGRGTLRWAEDGMSAAVARLEPAVLAGAVAVEFCWRGRVTRVYQRRGERWWGWCLDDWDNCVADGWLTEQARPVAAEARGAGAEPVAVVKSNIQPDPAG